MNIFHNGLANPVNRIIALYGYARKYDPVKPRVKTIPRGRG